MLNLRQQDAFRTFRLYLTNPKKFKMENQSSDQAEDNRKLTEELLEQSVKLREQSQATNEKLADIKKRTEELLHPHDKSHE